MRLYLKTKTILQLTSYLKVNNDCLIPKISIKDVSSNLFFITALVVPDSAVRQEKKRKKKKSTKTVCWVVVSGSILVYPFSFILRACLHSSFGLSCSKE